MQKPIINTYLFPFNVLKLSKSKTLRKGFFLSVILCFFTNLIAQPLVLNNQINSVDIGKRVLLFEDKENKYSIEDIQKPEFQSNFIPSKLNVPNFGVTKSTIWCKIEVKNQAELDWVLSVGFPIIEDIKLYYPENGKYKFKSSGKLELLKNREMKSVDFVFYLPFEKQKTDSSTTFYLRSEGRVILLPLTIGKPEVINQASQTQALYYVFYLGLVCMLFFYNLAIFIITREKEYFYYVCWIFFSIIYFMILKGYAVQIFPESLHFLIPHTNIYSSVAGACIVLFVISSLHLKALFPAMLKWYYAILAGFALVFVLSLLKQFHIATTLIQPLLLISVLLGLISGIVVYKKGYAFAFYYMLAFAQNFVSMSIYVLIFQNVFEFNVYTSNSVMLGIGIEMILLAFGLGAKIKSIQREKAQAQREAFRVLQEKEKLVKEQNEILEIKVSERTHQLEIEKKKSDDLLLNILPQDIADELKETGSSAARRFNHVTVLFADFVNFTGVSEMLTPEELVAQIDYCFKGFDGIIGKYNIEKIKTIGDAYLAVCGLPNENDNHAANIINAAKEICEFMLDFERKRTEQNKPFFKIRVGINSGPVIAGIVGIKKFAYDIWGDTVNVAARMEQNSTAGKINISESTHALVINDFTFEYRGKIEAKNKGLIDMYFVN